MRRNACRGWDYSPPWSRICRVTGCFADCRWCRASRSCSACRRRVRVPYRHPAGQPAGRGRHRTGGTGNDPQPGPVSARYAHDLGQLSPGSLGLHVLLSGEADPATSISGGSSSFSRMTWWYESTGIPPFSRSAASSPRAASPFCPMCRPVATARRLISRGSSDNGLQISTRSPSLSTWRCPISSPKESEHQRPAANLRMVVHESRAFGGFKRGHSILVRDADDPLPRGSARRQPRSSATF